MNSAMGKLISVLISLLGQQVVTEAVSVEWPSGYSVEYSLRDGSAHRSKTAKLYFSQDERAIRLDTFGGMNTYVWEFKGLNTSSIYYYFPANDNPACVLVHYGTGLNGKKLPSGLPSLVQLKHSRNLTVNGAPVQEWSQKSSFYETYSEETYWLRMADNESSGPIPVMYAATVVNGSQEHATLTAIRSKWEFYNYLPQEPEKSVWHRPQSVECVIQEDDTSMIYDFLVEILPWFSSLIPTWTGQNPSQGTKKKHKGLKINNTTFVSALPFPYSDDEIQLKVRQLPKTLDWRLSGAVTSVKDQGYCASCWAFAIVGAMEGAYFLQSRILGDMSVQALVDCGWATNNAGCFGGDSSPALEWIKNHGGLPWAAAYGDYKEANGRCELKNIKPVAPIEGFVPVKPNVDAVKVALYEHGPLTISIDADRVFLGYNQGVLNGSCDSGATDHCVLLIGYGTLNGEDYWLIKNSWGEKWGLRGYGLISTENNAYCVLNEVYYPVLKKLQPK